MSYIGVTARIPLGLLGLLTDDDPMKIPPGALIRAQNVQIRKNLIEKEPGSRKYNQTSLSSPVVGVRDWHPDDITQHLVSVTGNGKVYKISKNGYQQTEVVAGVNDVSVNAPATLIAGQPFFIEGGVEQSNSPRKLFILSANNQIQVITGDGTTRKNIAKPAADWPSVAQGATPARLPAYPTHGINYGGRLWVVVGSNLYASSVTNHEDFSTIGAALLFSVYPGDAEQIRGLGVWKGRLHILKYPHGLYYLDDTSATTSDWAIRKLSDSFGGGQIQCIIPALDDLLVANETGSISSMHAVQALGGVDVGDVMNLLRCEDFTRQTTKNSDDRQCVYYADRKQALFTYRSVGGTQLDRILKIDLNHAKAAAFSASFQISDARVTWTDKDQATCLGLMKDFNRIERPVYGSDDGYVYLMDQVDRDVGGSAYTMDFQTPYMDMSHIDPKYSDMNKIFDFLQITFIPTGLFNVSVDVFIDDRFIETITYPMASASADILGDKTATTATDFMLGDSGAPASTDGYLEGEVTFNLMKPLHGEGKRISLRCYNAGLRHTIRLSALTVYFRPAGQEAGKE